MRISDWSSDVCSSDLPIVGAKSLVILRYDNSSAELEMPETDANGLAKARFAVPPALPGAQVIVEVHIRSGEVFLTFETTSFQWWRSEESRVGTESVSVCSSRWSPLYQIKKKDN